MAYVLGDYILDNGLDYLNTGTLTIHLLTSDPANYGEVSSKTCGNKSFSAGDAFGACAAHSPNGRQVTSTAISDGTVTTATTANRWCVVDASRLLANGTLTAPVVLGMGQQWTLDPFVIAIPNQAA